MCNDIVTKRAMKLDLKRLFLRKVGISYTQWNSNNVQMLTVILFKFRIAENWSKFKLSKEVFEGVRKKLIAKR